VFKSEKGWVPHHDKMRESKVSKSVVVLYASRGVASIKASSRGSNKLAGYSFVRRIYPGKSLQGPRKAKEIRPTMALGAGIEAMDLVERIVKYYSRIKSTS